MLRSFPLFLALYLSLPSLALADIDAYYRLSVAYNAEGDQASYRLNPLSGEAGCKSLKAPQSCADVELMLPESCDWECRDGLLSGRGTAVLKGQFISQDANPKAQFQVLAGFDTWQKKPIRGGLLKLSSQDARCGGDACTGTFKLENLQTGLVLTVDKLDFQKADDPNYRLEAERVLPSLLSAEGLLVTGKRLGKTLSAQLVFRPWILPSSCDPKQAVQDFVTNSDRGRAFAFIASENEAQQLEDGRSFYWALLLESGGSEDIYRTGINDLWATELRVNKANCSIEVLAEH